MKNSILAVVLLAFSLPAVSAGQSKNCSIIACGAGTKAVTYAKKDDPYYSCPSYELSEYTNSVLGFVAVSYRLSGQFPKISPVTGEPVFSGDAKAMLDMLRNNAKVRTFDQAVSYCSQGKNKLSVTVVSNPADSLSMRVSDKGNNQFWMPKSHLDRQ